MSRVKQRVQMRREGLDTINYEARAGAQRAASDVHRCCDWIAERDRTFAENLRAKAAPVSEGAQKVPVLVRLDQRHTRLAEACTSEANLADVELAVDQIVQQHPPRHQVAAAVRLLDVDPRIETKVLDHLAFDQKPVSSVISRPGRRCSENLPLSVK